MTKAIFCDCGLVCRGDSDEELLREAARHLAEEHPALAGRVRSDDLLAMAVEIDPEPPADEAGEADEPLVIRHRRAVVILTLNRPRSRNALSLDLIRRLTSVLGAVGADTGVRAVVIAGAGPVFCSGHDLRELRAADRNAVQDLFAADAVLMRTVRELPQPVVARVQGPATGAGCHLVAACDLAVASSHATFAVPGPVIGLVGTTAMVEVGRLIGRRRAMQMVLTGAPIAADTALAWGLVNAVVSERELSAAAEAMARSASAGAPGTIALAKRGLHEALDRPIDQAYSEAVALTARTVPEAEAQEGIAAFLDKRPPKWRSRAERG
jgi:enoyl-CoA hydratase/carnithine racemase/predicted small metal-binding protein